MAPLPIERDALKPGDHIYSWRGWGWWSYAHHGICDEENRVIHFNVDSEKSFKGRIGRSVASSATRMKGPNKCSDCGYSGPGGVIKTCLNCFLNGGKIYRYEYGVSTKQYKYCSGGTCHTVVADKSRIRIILRARYLLKHGFGHYSLTDNNCENFATRCMTGTQGIISGQVDKGWTYIWFGSWFGEFGEENTREDIGDSTEGFCNAIWEESN